MPSNFKALAGAAGGGDLADPNFKNVTLLLHGDGSNGAQNNTFIDSSTNNFTITRNGNTTQGSFSPYGSNWSNYFDGSGDYLTVSDNAAFNLNTGAWTIEAWIYPTNPSGYQTIITKRSAIWEIGIVGSALYWYNGTVYSTTLTVNSNSWNHVAVTSDGTTVKMFVNGVLDRSITSANPGSGASDINIGSYATQAVFGYISNLRVVKGTQVYTGNFSVPTAPLTAITNTSLLTCSYNRFRDGSANNFTITRNGDVKVTNFAPFAPSSAYSTATNGGSAYFDGTGDYLTASSNTAFGVGLGDFTIEAWIYPTGAWTSGGYNCLLQIDGTGIYFGQNNAGFGLRQSGTANIISYGTSPTLNTWTHVAIVRSGTTVTMYYNGTSVATATSIANFSSGNAWVGADAGPSSYYAGLISNMRLVKGTAVYTANFTPPTSPVTAISGTSLLLNATNAAIFDNSMKNDLETVGNAQISTSVKKFGTGSIYFDGSGDNLFYPSNQSADCGTGNWTFEAWVYISTRTTNYPLIFGNNRGSWTTDAIALTASNSDNAAYNDKFVFGWNNGGFSSVSAGTSQLLVSNTTNSTGTWYHFAVVRNGTSVKMYRNGTEVASATVSSGASFNWGYNGTLLGGGNWDGAQSYFNGYLDDVRLSKVARYTSSFTPPTAAFPNK